jgi:P4 family phage/plasmid primase-like protien
LTDPRGWDLSDLNDIAETLDADNPTAIGSSYGRTDYDNARRLALYEGENLRYVNDSDKWFKWCETNWCEATFGDRFGFASRVALRIGQDEVRHIDDGDERDRHTVWGQHSLSETRLRSMVNVASGIDSFRIDSTELDARGHLLNFPNCTLDPRTLDEYPHRREDLLTQLCATSYDPNAYSLRLNEFLERFLPDKQERDYLLQVIAVSALSYGNAARRLVLLLGPTSTGKSTLMELVMKTLGRDYTAAVNPSVFRGNLDDKPRPDLLRALKTRLILAFEASERWELHTDQIKRMTGGDAITARGMRSDVMNETVASFVPFIVANQSPTIHGSDDALRRRLLALKMDAAVAIDEDDGVLRHELVNDSEARRALLAQLVQIYHNCAGKVNLPIPPRFAEATMDLFASLDDVHEVLHWLKEDGSLYEVPSNTSNSHCAQVSILFKCYSLWIEQNGTHQMKRDKLGLKQFAQRLRGLGYDVQRTNGSRVIGWCLGNTTLVNMSRI